MQTARRCLRPPISVTRERDDAAGRMPLFIERPRSMCGNEPKECRIGVMMIGLCGAEARRACGCSIVFKRIPLMAKVASTQIAKSDAGGAAAMPDAHGQGRLDIAPTLQRAIFNSANFSSIATDAKGVIQIFNVGAERMLGYTAAEVTDKITPADISDPQEVIARAKLLSVELATPIEPGFDALVFKASRRSEDTYD